MADSEQFGIGTDNSNKHNGTCNDLIWRCSSTHVSHIRQLAHVFNGYDT